MRILARFRMSFLTLFYRQLKQRGSMTSCSSILNSKSPRISLTVFPPGGTNGSHAFVR